MRRVPMSLVTHGGYKFCKLSTSMYAVANCRGLKDGVISGND